MATRNYYTSVVMGSTFENTYSMSQQNNALVRVAGLSGLASPGSAWGISGWFKIPASNTTTISLAGHDATPGAGRFTVALANTAIILEVIVVNQGQKRDQIWTQPTGGYRDNNWHHIYVGTSGYSYDITTVEIFIDGIKRSVLLRNELLAADTWTITSGALTGQSSGVGTGTFIDELAYFNYNPGAAACYNSGVPFDLTTLATPPTDYLRFENNLTNSGSNGGTAALVTGAMSYSTDVP
jgi:hypothetical protein